MSEELIESLKRAVEITDQDALRWREHCSRERKELTAVKQQLDEAKEMITQLVLVHQCADENGYVADHGFIDLDGLFLKANAIAAKGGES